MKNRYLARFAVFDVLRQFVSEIPFAHKYTHWGLTI